MMLRNLAALLLLVTSAAGQRPQKNEEQKPLGCFDAISVGDCQFMRNFGFCEEDIEVLKTKCDKTCGWCSEGNECVDKAQYLDCNDLTQAQCDDNATFYISRCRKSCNWCEAADVWGEWSSWSTCPKDCGHARKRARKCLSSSCTGKKVQKRACPNKCPTWANWGPWSICNASCDKGGRTRTRKCQHGRRCPGEPSQFEFCQLKPCLEGWEPWGVWTECSASCGTSYKYRTRVCSVGECEGSARDWVPCPVADCPIWEDWSVWSNCSVTCGKGERSRTRNCKNGPGCDGDVIETKVCELPSCSGYGLQFDRWTPCSRTCGSGTRVKLLKCPDMDINICPREYKDCNTIACRFRKCRDYRYEGSGSRPSYSSCCKNTAAKCGKNVFQTRSFRWKLVGGEKSIPKQFPWMARLELIRQAHEPSFTDHHCGGTLINPQYVATAAHCVEQIRDKTTLAVIMGATSRADTSTYVQRIGVAEIYMHPNFTTNAIVPPFDIAILRLQRPVFISEHVKTICLPNGEETPVDAKCFIAGWGYRHFAYEVASTNLMEARVRNLPFDLCRQSYPSESGHLNETHMICAGKVAGGVDTCKGDSGGPVMCQRCSTCSWYLAGITSGGSSQCGTRNLPGIYTRVKFYEDWIATIVEPTETLQYSCPV